MDEGELIVKLENELDDFVNVKYRMSAEGIDYCFKHYSTFSEIEDAEFHKLRKKFLKSMEELENYVDSKITKLTDELNELGYDENY
jgi:hypothetical protein